MRRIGTLSAVLAVLLLKSVPVLGEEGQDDPTSPAPSDAVTTTPPGTTLPVKPAPPDDGRWVASFAVKSPAIPAMGVSHVGERWTARVETGMLNAEVAGSADLQRSIVHGGPFALLAGLDATTHYFPLDINTRTGTSNALWGIGPAAGVSVKAGPILVSADAAILHGDLVIGHPWTAAYSARAGLAF